MLKLELLKDDPIFIGDKYIEIPTYRIIFTFGEKKDEEILSGRYLEYIGKHDYDEGYYTIKFHKVDGIPLKSIRYFYNNEQRNPEKNHILGWNSHLEPYNKASNNSLFDSLIMKTLNMDLFTMDVKDLEPYIDDKYIFVCHSYTWFLIERNYYINNKQIFTSDKFKILEKGKIINL